MRTRAPAPALALAAYLLLSGLGSADDTRDAFFENRVRPILANHCIDCHGEKKQKGGLRLDSRAGWERGGDNGPAIVPGKSAESLFFKAVLHSDPDLKMPPKEPLAPSDVEALAKWIDSGAADPRTAAVRPVVDPEQAKRHWSFQPLAHTSPPPVHNPAWCRNSIDQFILARLESAHLQPSPQADKATLLRRASFDLTGLPPSEDDLHAFLADDSPRAWEQVVDRLLASPQYGERWGRHWLDLARYADTCGFHNDLDRPHAWRYRDYVIDSFNADKPYQRFVAEQLAGDEVTDADELTLVATGFCRNGPSNDDNMGVDREQYRMDQLDDVVSTTANVFLGLTIGCARCHDHKTDPFSSADYYSLIAVFYGTEKRGVPKEPPPKDPDKNSDPEKAAKPQPINYHALVETKATVRPVHILRRGSVKNPGAIVDPAVPAVLSTNHPLPLQPPQAGAKSSGRRIALAQWITSEHNPLTWRVLANRIWQHHFGSGLVATPSNFGFKGSSPTHPELLDFLAHQLLESGGRWKPLHRLILLSAAYQQESRARTDAFQTDPENRLLWRMPMRRLEAEAIRDAILSSAGTLNTRAGGPGIKPRIRPELLTASQRNKWPQHAEEGPELWRRSVYIYVKRQLLMPMLELFDAPTTTDSCPERIHSVLPTQALVLMNDEFVEDHAALLAQHAWESARGDFSTAIRILHERTLSKPPTAPRLAQSLAFLQTQTSAGANPVDALADLAHVLFNSSEFLSLE